jgi:hypothetical protein
VSRAATISGVGSQAAEDGDQPGSVPFVANSLTRWNGRVETHLAALAASEDPPRMVEVERATARRTRSRSSIG